MKVIKIYNQHRRDCYIDLECENCEEKKINHKAYDDRNFWDNVVPALKCKKCEKSSNDLEIKNEEIRTKYKEWENI